MLEYIANRDATLGNALNWNIILEMKKTTKIGEKDTITRKAIGKLNANNATKLSKDQSTCKSAQCHQFCLLETD